MKTSEGREIMARLVRKTDIFIENMRPGVPEELGFSYRMLRRLNPKLIYCSIKGFSSRSRDRNRSAFDAVAQAMSGMMSLTGEPAGEPLRIGNPSVDLGAGAYGAIGVLAAVIEQSRTGRGKFIEISLLDMATYWNGYWVTYYGMTGKVPSRLGSGHPGFSPHRVFQTSNGRYLLIAALSDRHWRDLSRGLKIHLGREYNDLGYRLAHRTQVEQAVQDAVGKLNSTQVLERLKDSVPCAPVRSIDEVYADAELRELGILRNISYSSSDGERTVRMVVAPISRDRTVGNGKDMLRTPEVGEDNEQILKSLNYGKRQILALKRKRII